MFTHQDNHKVVFVYFMLIIISNDAIALLTKMTPTFKDHLTTIRGTSYKYEAKVKHRHPLTAFHHQFRSVPSLPLVSRSMNFEFRRAIGVQELEKLGLRSILNLLFFQVLTPLPSPISYHHGVTKITLETDHVHRPRSPIPQQLLPTAASLTSGGGM
ncbi:hypothetical protein QVD17_11188 [Tagetes erecta]|uniref:Uncharacterized protein n=1 Tax=Tagetes erecta TaxID=13708 RepID=A0AAD8P1S8_TARER|nr:hypothetical protein QVD17_11188 [Tagetes erecta]